MSGTEGLSAEERIRAGRIKHGVGSSEDFPGNVCHLVSPVVGFLRLRNGTDEPVDMDWMIDRLALVLDMARQEAAERDALREQVARAAAQLDALGSLSPVATSGADVQAAYDTAIRAALHPTDGAS